MKIASNMKKYEKGTSRAPTKSKFGMVVEYFRRNNFHFGQEFTFQKGF
jgi:hypothetical protein